MSATVSHLEELTQTKEYLKEQKIKLVLKQKAHPAYGIYVRFIGNPILVLLTMIR